MKKINNKGITLMALVITIIILIILASIGTYSGIQVVKSAQFTAFSTELKIMQTQVNSLYEKKKNNEKILLNNVETEIEQIGTPISSDPDAQEQAYTVFTASASGITREDIPNYKYFDTNTIKSLNIEGVEGEFFVNVNKRSVVSYEGFEYEGKTYYTLEQLPDGLYNVEYNTSQEQPDFDVNYELLENGKCKISVNNINYNGNINKWKIEYKKENEEDWKQSNNYSFIIDEVGNYRVKIANNNTESREKQIIAKSSLLPSEFQEVEYIESTGTQYIDTGIIPTINTSMDIELAITTNDVNWSGSVLDANRGWFAVGGYNLNSLVAIFSVSSRAGILDYPFDTNFHKFFISNGLQKIDNITSNNTISNYNGTMPSIYLLGEHYTWSANPPLVGHQKIKYCKLFDNNLLVKNFIPCYRESDNKPGLYDLVNNEFYTNQGTGDFEKGKDIDSGINTIIINNL